MPERKMQSPIFISADTIFLACNFDNKRIKLHFDRLKKKWESSLPVCVYLSDKVRGRGAGDLWNDISQTIREANLAIFDVTSFRPNVVLELGCSLAIKRPDQIIICRDITPNGKRRKIPEKWQLSDIPHLFRIEYKIFNVLDEQLLQHINRMAPVRNFYDFIDEIERHSELSSKLYIAEAIDAINLLRDKGAISRHAFRAYLLKHEVDPKILEGLLIKYDLAKPDPGKDGKWKKID